MSSEESSSLPTSHPKEEVAETEGVEKRSINVRLIRHSHSHNNQVYTEAKALFAGGTPDFDSVGWTKYVDKHRSADPGLSPTGRRQAERLADFLVPHIVNQVSEPVRIITSPMRRALETIRPTVRRLHALHEQQPQQSPQLQHITVNGFYHESEGCHSKNKAIEGMAPEEIKTMLLHGKAELEEQSGGNNDETKANSPREAYNVDFVGFPDPNRGWYCNGIGAESREQAEDRAARFYLWLMETLDQQLLEASAASAAGSDVVTDVFDAGVSQPGEETENEHDKHAPRKRRRRTTLLVGHGDFMSLLLKRIVAGFGHSVETAGIPHRSAFVHYNTGITELEYFGNGRFLVMGQNQTPHLSPEEYGELRCGGSLKDGWSYLMPNDKFVLNAEVSIAFSDEEMEDHVREQTNALRALYLSSVESDRVLRRTDDCSLSVDRIEDDQPDINVDDKDPGETKHFIVKRGFQVVGVATYSDQTGQLTDVAIRPSAGREASEKLFSAVIDYARRKFGRSRSLLVYPRSSQSKALFESMGFKEVANERKEGNEKEVNSALQQMELKH